MFELRALLVIGFFATFGFCFGAAAETCDAASGGVLVSPLSEAKLADEASRRESGLIQQGFTVTQLILPQGPTQFEFLVEQSDNVICLWFATEQGAIAAELIGPDRQPLVSWRGAQDERRLEQKLAVGKYVLEVRAIDGARVYGLIGIKRWAFSPCYSDNDRLTEQPADPPRYSWPYLLVKPLGLAADAPASAHDGTLIVMPNNIGFPSENIELLRASAICELRFGQSSGPLAIADGLGAPLLIPLFPRPLRPYLQALTRESLRKNEIRPELNRIDWQLIAMIDHARVQLASVNHPIQPRVLMVGFSASGMFTNRFTVLHPERVLAAAVGAPGGWPIAPVLADKGKALPYPVGIADINTEELGGKPVDLPTLQRVQFLFLLGTADTNDAVPCDDSFSADEASLINSLFGTVGVKCGEGTEPVVKRWWPAQRLYYSAGLNARFRLYADVRHEMGVTPVMWNDILDTFRKGLDAR